MVETPMDRFMKLEKSEAPDKWMEKNNFTGEMVNTLQDITGVDIILPYNKATFYEIIDAYESIGIKHFKIYPILDKEFWIVEVEKNE